MLFAHLLAGQSPLESFVVSFLYFFGVFFVAYNSRLLLFYSALCSVDITTYRALSRSRLRSFGHMTSRLMGLGAYPEPIYHGMTL